MIPSDADVWRRTIDDRNWRQIAVVLDNGIYHDRAVATLRATALAQFSDDEIAGDQAAEWPSRNNFRQKAAADIASARGELVKLTATTSSAERRREGEIAEAELDLWGGQPKRTATDARRLLTGSIDDEQTGFLYFLLLSGFERQGNNFETQSTLREFQQCCGEIAQDYVGQSSSVGKLRGMINIRNNMQQLDDGMLQLPQQKARVLKANRMNFKLLAYLVPKGSKLGFSLMQSEGLPTVIAPATTSSH